MKSFDSVVARTRVVLRDHPLPLLFPQEPWSEEDLAVIADILADHIATSGEVVSDYCPYVEWLERYYFHQSAQQ